MAIDGDVVELDIGDEPVEATVEEDQFELTVSDGPAEEVPAVDTEALAAQLEALKEEKEVLAKQADSSAQMTAAFENFAAKLQPQSSSPTVAPKGPQQVQIDWAALEGQVNEESFKNPFQATMKAVAPAFQQLQNEVKFELEAVRKKNQLLDSKLALTGDTELSGVYGKFKDEIDAKVAVGGDYLAAARETRMAHMDDIIAEKVAEALANQKEEAAPAAPRSGFTNSGSMTSIAAKASSGGGPRVSTAMYEQMRQQALNWAMDPDDKAVMKDIYNDYKAAGLIK